MKREYPAYIWMVFPNPDNGCNEWYLGCDPPETKPERRKYIPAPKRKPGVQVMLDMIEHSLCCENDYGNLSDAEFAEVLLEEVWADMSVDTKACALVEMAIERLRGEK